MKIRLILSYKHFGVKDFLINLETYKTEKSVISVSKEQSEIFDLLFKEFSGFNTTVYFSTTNTDFLRVLENIVNYQTEVFYLIPYNINALQLCFTSDSSLDIEDFFKYHSEMLEFLGLVSKDDYYYNTSFCTVSYLVSKSKFFFDGCTEVSSSILNALKYRFDK